MIEFDYLRECLSYFPETGEVIWRERPKEHFQTKRVWKMWNSRYAGKPIRTIPDNNGYLVLRLTIDGKVREVRTHRIIFAMQTGAWPTAEVDHKNRNKLDNRWVNLRLATHAENQHNCGIQSNNTSGFHGISLTKGKWQARIKTHGRRRSLGLFRTPEEAHAAYLKAKIEMHPFYEHSSG